MNREELTKICHRHCVVTPFHTLVDDILAALEKEREGEVCFWIGDLDLAFANIEGIKIWAIDNNVSGKRGQLIFRPTKAEKGGE